MTVLIYPNGTIVRNKVATTKEQRDKLFKKLMKEVKK